MRGTIITNEYYILLKSLARVTIFQEFLVSIRAVAQYFDLSVKYH